METKRCVREFANILRRDIRRYRNAYNAADVDEALDYVSKYEKAYEMGMITAHEAMWCLSKRFYE